MNAVILRKKLVLRRISELFEFKFDFSPLARKLYPHFEMDKNLAFHRWMHNLNSFSLFFYFLFTLNKVFVCVVRVLSHQNLASDKGCSKCEGICMWEDTIVDL